jgi:hypothetical protein
MTDYYEQELRETAKPGEYQIFYIKKTLTAEKELEIAQLKTINESNNEPVV